jgi:hypothetical protein
LANLDTVGWRNFANSGNLLLGVNGSDQLTFNGSPMQPLLSLMDGQIWIGDGTNTPIGRTLSGDVTVTDLGVTSIGALKITNAMVSNSAAITYTKLNLTGSIVNTDIGSSAAIAYSKLSLSASIVNADIATAAAIAYSKLAALTPSVVLVSDGSGFVSASSVTSATLAFLDATSSIQTQLNGKQASGSYLTTTLADTKIWVGNGSNIATAVNLSNDATLADTGALTLATVNSNIGSFTLASITVDAKGRVTAASSGSAGAGTVTSVTGTANQIDVATGTTTPVLSISSTFVFPGTISANSHKITSLTNGSVVSDAAAYGQVFLLQSPTQGTYATAATNTSNTYADTGISITISPVLTTGHVLIDADVPIKVTGTAALVPSVDLIITDNANTTVQEYLNVTGVNAPTTTQSFYSTIRIRGWDAPGSTSAKTYKVRFRLNSNAVGTGSTCTTCYAGVGQTTAFITATEYR